MSTLKCIWHNTKTNIRQSIKSSTLFKPALKTGINPVRPVTGKSLALPFKGTVHNQSQPGQISTSDT